MFEFLLDSYHQHPQVAFALHVGVLIVAAILSHYFVKSILRRIARFVARQMGSYVSEMAQDEVIFARLSMFVPALLIHQCVVLI